MQPVLLFIVVLQYNSVSLAIHNLSGCVLVLSPFILNPETSLRMQRLFVSTSLRVNIYQSGAKILWMSFLKKLMTMIISLNFTLTSSPKLPKFLPSTQQRWRLVKTSLRNISKLDALYHRNPSKPLPSSYQRRKEPYVHAKIIATWIPTLSEMPTHSPSFWNSSMTWKNPPCSPNSTFNGDITTFAFKKRNSGKLHSSPSWDCLNPPSCSSGSVMHPPCPKCYKSYLCWHAEGEMAKNLHGWSRNPHEGQHHPPPWTYWISTSISSGTQTVNQTL